MPLLLFFVPYSNFPVCFLSLLFLLFLPFCLFPFLLLVFCSSAKPLLNPRTIRGFSYTTKRVRAKTLHGRACQPACPRSFRSAVLKTERRSYPRADTGAYVIFFVCLKNCVVWDSCRQALSRQATSAQHTHMPGAKAAVLFRFCTSGMFHVRD